MKARFGELQVEIELNSTHTAEAIRKALPIDACASRWGDEIYFEIPLKLPAEKATENLSVGDVAYWPQGHCFCLSAFAEIPSMDGDECDGMLRRMSQKADNPQRFDSRSPPFLLSARKHGGRSESAGGNDRYRGHARGAPFFGRTPASTTDQPRPASAVNLIGRVRGDAKVLQRVKEGTSVRLCL